LKLNKEIELSCKSLGREFHAAGAEKPKLWFPNDVISFYGRSDVLSFDLLSINSVAIHRIIEFEE